LYSQAFAQEPQFYSFIRSLKAYESSFEGSDNMMILKPDSDFFRFMQAPKK
jgi:protein hflC